MEENKAYQIKLEWGFFSLLEELNYKPKESFNCLGNLIGNKDEDVLLFFKTCFNNIEDHKNKEAQFERVLLFLNAVIVEKQKLTPFKELEELKDVVITKYVKL